MIKTKTYTGISDIINNLQDAVIVMNRNLEVTKNNKSAIKLFGFDLVKDQQKTLNLFNKIGMTDKCMVTLSTHKPKTHETTFHDENIEITYLASIDSIGEEEILITLRNISYLKKIEQEKSKKINIINKAREMIRSTGNEEKLFSILGDYLLTIASAHMGALIMKHNNEKKIVSSWLKRINASEYISEFEANFPDSLEFVKIEDNSLLIESSMKYDEVIWEKEFMVKKNLLNPGSDDELDIVIEDLICVPLRTTKGTIGAICLVRTNDIDNIPFEQDDLEILETIASLAASTIENAKIQKQKLHEQKITQELKVAHDIQKRILPKSLPSMENFDFGGISIPARGIGGDYYDFLEIERNNKNEIGIAVVDVIGKGIPAALITIMMKSILQKDAYNIKSSKEAMSCFNQSVYKETAIQKFVPMFYCVVKDKEESILYTNAGHEFPIYYQSKKNKFHTIDTEGFPTGGMDDTEFEEKELKMNEGDIVSIATDGIVEARNPEGENYGEKRLKNEITKHKNLPANKIVDKIYTSVIDFIKDAPQHDDLTLVIIKKKNNKTTKHVKEKVLWEKTIEITSDTKYVKVIRSIVEEASSLLFNDSSTVYDIKLAVNEAHSNIIRHAYSGQKDQPIKFNVKRYAKKIEFYFEDYGKTPGELSIKQTRSLDDFQGNGLGVFLIKNVMDDVTYDIDPETGTKLTMIKYIDKE